LIIARCPVVGITRMRSIQTLLIRVKFFILFVYFSILVSVLQGYYVVTWVALTSLPEPSIQSRYHAVPGVVGPPSV
jgi:uncharacterized membrane protein